MVAVSGGSRGVGGTTVAVNLAAALSETGCRTALADVSMTADATRRADVDDRLCRGPDGILLLSADPAMGALRHGTGDVCQSWLEQLAEIEARIDVIVVDCGGRMTRWTQSIWQRAQLVLLVTTPDDPAILDAYATIKHGCAAAKDEVLGSVRLLFNQCDDAEYAAGAHRRMAHVCQRFLGSSIERAPRLPRCSQVSEAFSRASIPLAWEAPATPFGRSVYQLGRFVGDVLSQHRQRGTTTELGSVPRQELSPC